MLMDALKENVVSFVRPLTKLQVSLRKQTF